MNRLELVELSYKYQLGSFDLASWVWAATALLVVIFLLGLGWGLLWNRRWGLFTSAAGAFVSILFGLLAAAAVLAWCGAERMLASLEADRDRLAASLNAKGELNREAFRAAWDKLELRGGQKELTEPAKGGQELRLNNPEEAKIVAQAAAQVVKRHLQGQGAFAYGLPVTVRDPAAVADEVVTAMPRPNYPVIITPANEWSRAAVARQVGAAIEYANKVLAAPVVDLKTALTAFILALLAVHVLIIPIMALSDIKEHPQVATA